MVDTINELSEVSRKLNQKSDTLNTTIATINQKLAKLNLGIETWLSAPIETGDPFYEPGDEDGRCPMRYEMLLGYCRIDENWELATKHVTVGTDNDGEKFMEILSARAPQSLLKASRNLRAGAMERIPHLLTLLKCEAEHLLKSIEEAKTVADKL